MSPRARRINLCFHGIGTPQRELESGEAAYWISPEVFTAVLDEVHDRPEVALSFDDGNASDIEIGLSELERRGLSATFFVLAARLDARGSLSRDDVRELRGRGMRIGTHGMDHVPWRGLDDASARRELLEARDVIAEVTGVAVSEAALPLGRYDRRTLARLRSSGYSAVHTSDRRPARAGSWLQPRFSLRSTDDLASVRAEALTPMPLPTLLKRTAVGTVKRLR